MKKISFAAKLSILIFVLVIILSLAVSRPLYKFINENVNEYTEEMKSKVTELTGLTFTYESFSPSILSSFNIKGIKLSDDYDLTVLSIKNIKIDYKFTELLRGNLNSIIKTVTVNNVDVDIDQLVSSLKQNIDFQKGNFVSINEITKFIPANVNVKNIALNYNNDDFDSSFLIKDISLNNAEWKKSMDFQMDCKSSVFLKKNKTDFSGSVYVTGSIPDDFENSTVYLNVSDFTNGSFRLAKTNLLVTYSQNKVDLHTIKSVNPLSIKANLDFTDLMLELAVDTEKLNPLSIVSTAGKSETAKLLKEILITTSTKVDVDLNKALEYFQGKKNSNFVNYSSKGSFNVPSKVLPGGAFAEYNIFGNDRKINCPKIRLNGKNVIADCDLSYSFKNMQLSGNANLEKFVMKNGCEISTEVFFDPLSNGFMLFSPQVFIGEKALTALQAKILPKSDSVDFEVEVYDYFNYESGEPGLVSLSGSYLMSSNFIQTGISMNSIYLQSVFETTQQLLDENQKTSIEKIIKYVQPYMFTGDLFVSTNFSSISYNLPYLVLANTQKDNELLFISVNGNEQNIQLDRFDLIFGKFAMNASAGIDFIPGEKNVTFYLDATTASIPYHFQGAVGPEVLKIAGDYGTDVEIDFLKNKAISGHAFIENLPVAYENNSIILSTNTEFNYSQQTGPEIQISKFEIEKTDASSAYNPKLVLSGNGTKYGAQLNSISYTDLYSTLQGNADITVNINDNIFDSVGFIISLKDSTGSGEGINFDGIVSNPDGNVLNKDTIKNALYISALAEISNLSLNRFMAVKNSNNELSATLSLSGTLEHPYALVNVDRLSFLLANEIVYANGSVTLEDSDFTINDFALNQSSWCVKNMAGNVSLKEFTGKVDAAFETKGDKNISIPMSCELKDSYVPEGKNIPESLMISLGSSGFAGTLIKKSSPFEINAMYTPDFISFYSSENMGLVGTYTSTDGLYASMNIGQMLSCEANGKFTTTGMDVYFSNLIVNLPDFIDCFALDDVIKISSGKINGNLEMSGTYDTPEFDGLLTIDEPKFTIPMVFENVVSTDKIVFTAKDNEFTLVDGSYSVGKNQVFKLGSNLSLNKWVIDQINISLKTINKKFLPLKLSSPVINVNGEIACDLDVKMADSIWDVNGSVYGEKIDIESALQNITKANAENSDKEPKEIYFRTNLDLILGNHIVFNFNPLLRCIFVPNTKLKIALDSITQSYVIDGKLSLKSGDVAYLNRSFYIKEGSIKFNPSEIMNPKITIRAETREKDENNQNVRIILTAENQDLLDFKPRFSSVPAKSENEIMSLLGQVVIADLNEIEKGSDILPVILSTAGDYALQSLATRQIENKLRESLNFDIFSIRTNILQNTMSLVKDNQMQKADNAISLGNFFDNSTVYIGKYLSSAIYVDAMLNLSLGNGVANLSDVKEKGFILQPEIGLEFEVPFTNTNWRHIQDMDANFRVGMSMDAIFSDNRFDDYVFNPSFTMSLLWRF